jgi:hypothetical protein
MQTVTLRSYVGEDGVLRLDIPIELKNIDLEVVLVLQPVGNSEATQPKQTLARNLAWEKLDQARQRHTEQTFSDSTELLRENRQR